MDYIASLLVHGLHCKPVGAWITLQACWCMDHNNETFRFLLSIVTVVTKITFNFFLNASFNN